jgi:hypothetical protein
MVGLVTLVEAATVWQLMAVGLKLPAFKLSQVTVGAVREWTWMLAQGFG